MPLTPGTIYTYIIVNGVPAGDENDTARMNANQCYVQATSTEVLKTEPKDAS